MARDAFLLRAMGSPDPRQIDGMGGADPLTSKVAVVSRGRSGPGVDVDYLFLQVFRRSGDRVTDSAELRQYPGGRWARLRSSAGWLTDHGR